MRDEGVGNDKNDVPIIPPSASNFAPAVLNRDRTCWVSDYTDNVQCAHLCPSAEKDWFEAQSMAQYNLSPELSNIYVVSDIANAITLREDIHTTFDEHGFVLTRKFGVWMAHFLQLTRELGPCYHNTRIQIHSSVSHAFLLTRFAYSIFPFLSSFLNTNQKRVIRLQAENGNEQVKELGSNDLHIIMTKTRGRSESPKKRRIDDDQQTQQRKHHGVSPSRDFSSADASSSIDLSSNNLLNLSPASNKSSTSTSTTPSASRRPDPTPKRHLDDIFDLEASYDNITDPEERRFAILRALELQKRRPSDPSLFCCDYAAAERAEQRGEQGPRKFGGTHLCMQCRGMEIVEDPEHDDDGFNGYGGMWGIRVVRGEK